MKFGVVLVTYNRLDKLKISLECYEKQTYQPSVMIVVNNNSTDGTNDYLEDSKKKKSTFKKVIINLDKNIGGSGGFYTGFKEILKYNVDYVWVSDDDAFPKENAFEIANNFLLDNNNKNIAAICGKVINRNNIDVLHRRRLFKFLNILVQVFVSKKEYKKEYFKLNLLTYVGSMININSLKKAGLPKKDYFIYCDDTEHSFRLSKTGDIFCVPNIEIIHDGPLNNGKDGVNWKLYYGVRNGIDFVKSNFDKPTYFTYRIYFRIKYYGMILLLWPNKIEGFKLVNKSIKDSKIGKTGLDDYYKPGWKPKNK